jgi:hypothetical protein
VRKSSQNPEVSPPRRGLSKDIELRQADLPPEARMMQAMVLSQ